MFKADFKYYKSKQPPPSLDNILDFSLPHLYKNKMQVKIVEPDNMTTTFFGLKPLLEWKLFELIGHPGFLFISNPFTTLGQRYWIVRSLKDFSRSPNHTNLDIHDIIPKTENWWNYCEKNSNVNLLKKLRWATLGYHHNWDSKVYSDDLKSDFPNDLGLLCNFFASVLNYNNFKAEAAIVNYYHMNSTLSGHTDHSEQNLEAPLFSFSFGQKAIFMLGGDTIDAKPTAMFLQSGDIIIMSKASRLSYHGVPKILYSDSHTWNESCEILNKHNEHFDKASLKICNDEVLWRPFKEYLEFSRININIRQVLNEGQLKLS